MWFIGVGLQEGLTVISSQTWLLIGGFANNAGWMFFSEIVTWTVCGPSICISEFPQLILLSIQDGEPL